MKLYFLSMINILSISKDETGNYPLQFIVDSFETDEEKEFFLEKYFPNFKELSFDKNGNHIIEKSLSKVKVNILNRFSNIILDNFIEFSSDVYAIKIIKIFVLRVSNNSDFFIKLEEIIFKNLSYCIINEYGNYLIQTIIENWNKKYSIRIINSFNGNLINLTINKYSSNVYEKLIHKLDKEAVDPLINEFLEKSKDPSLIYSYLKNHFFPFVFKKSISYLNKTNIIQIVNIIVPLLEKIKDKKIIERWNIIIEFCKSIIKSKSNPSSINKLKKEKKLNQNKIIYNNNNYFPINNINNDLNLNFNKFITPEIQKRYLLSPIILSNQINNLNFKNFNNSYSIIKGYLPSTLSNMPLYNINHNYFHQKK